MQHLRAERRQRLGGSFSGFQGLNFWLLISKAPPTGPSTQLRRCAAAGGSGSWRAAVSISSSFPCLRSGQPPGCCLP